MCEKQKIVKARGPSEKRGLGQLPRLPCPKVAPEYHTRRGYVPHEQLLASNYGRIMVYARVRFWFTRSALGPRSGLRLGLDVGVRTTFGELLSFGAVRCKNFSGAIRVLIIIYRLYLWCS